MDKRQDLRHFIFHEFFPGICGGEPRRDGSGMGVGNIDTEDMPINTCPNCGADVPPDSKYCPECGNQLQEMSVAAQRLAWKAARRQKLLKALAKKGMKLGQRGIVS